MASPWAARGEEKRGNWIAGCAACVGEALARELWVYSQPATAPFEITSFRLPSVRNCLKAIPASVWIFSREEWAICRLERNLRSRGRSMCRSPNS